MTLALRNSKGIGPRHIRCRSTTAVSCRADAPAEIVLDMSRLLSRSLHASPTGIDRVEMAYARTLMRLIPDRLRFGASHPCGAYGRLAPAHVARFLDRCEQRWEGGGEASSSYRWAWALDACWALRPRIVPPAERRRVVLQASPHHLDRPSHVAAKLRREQARFVALVHDLIPISHPEYARPGGASRHRLRLDTLLRHADGLITNSRATAEALVGYAGPALAGRPVRVAPLSPGRLLPSDRPTPWTGTDYYLCIGTIEPRKNVLFLLNLWRALAAEGGGSAPCPTLLLVGRRGWENENVVDMLDRCSAIAGSVIECGRLPDALLRRLMRDARAVLMPSFAEGFGLPVVEALAAGVPVIASDISAHREGGGDVPEYLDPLDGPAWRNALLDYCNPASPRRAAQLARLARWRPTTWNDHVGSALRLAEEVSA